MNITPEKLRKYAETCEGSTKIVLLAAASTIEDLQKDGWLSVGDALPLQSEWVLVFADGAMNCLLFDAYEQRFRDPTYAPCQNISISAISYWRHLPEIPKGETE